MGNPNAASSALGIIAHGPAAAGVDGSSVSTRCDASYLVSPLDGVYRARYVRPPAAPVFGGARRRFVFVVFIGVGDACGRARRGGSRAAASSIPTFLSVTDASANARANGVANAPSAFAFASTASLVFRFNVGVSVDASDALDVPEPKNPPSLVVLVVLVVVVVPTPFAVGVSNGVDARARANPPTARLARAASPSVSRAVSDANASARLAPGGGDANEATRDRRTRLASIESIKSRVELSRIDSRSSRRRAGAYHTGQIRRYLQLIQPKVWKCAHAAWQPDSHRRDRPACARMDGVCAEYVCDHGLPEGHDSSSYHTSPEDRACVCNRAHHVRASFFLSERPVDKSPYIEVCLLQRRSSRRVVATARRSSGWLSSFDRATTRRERRASA